MKCMVNIYKKITRKLKKCQYYEWNIKRIKREKELRAKLLPHYSSDKTQTQFTKKTIINIFNGNIYQGGLADRLRGIISTYIICKDLSYDYKLYFNNPFNLNDFFTSNIYHWSIDKNSLCMNYDEVEIIILETTTGAHWESQRQEKWLKKRIKNSQKKEIHVYTNAFFSYNYNYSQYFNELFKLSERLKNRYTQLCSQFGTYISVSARFLDLIGDFKETFGQGELPEEQKKDLINKTLMQINKLHQQYPKMNILVNSDSQIFLNAAKSFSFVIESPGTISHLDTSETSEYDYNEKTFIDFLLIANATKIYLLKTGKMHRSGYPFAASLLQNKPFQIIEF